MDQIKLTYKSIIPPCFILDKDEFLRSIIGFYNAMKSEFSQTIIGYSVKTNSLPYCLCIAREQGCYAEVVSADEYDLALLCGYRKDHIIYNGPMKSKETFIDAIIGGAIVNIETHRELDWLRELPKEGTYKVGLRLNVNISKVSSEDADADNDNSRFGYSDETNEFQNALRCIEQLNNVNLVGLHIHRTAHSRSVRFYKNSIKYACETMLKYGLKLRYIDVGGGYFGVFPNKPSYREYAYAFKEVLAGYGLDEMQVIVEPGNALIASCFSFLSEVIDVKHVEQDKWFITTDGSRNDIDPFFRKSSYLSEVITEGKGVVVDEQIISGCTCLEYDRLFSIYNKPLLQVGDKILYNNVGAYTMCLTPMFIRYIPNVYVREGEDYYQIREKWSAIEHIQKSYIQ